MTRRLDTNREKTLCYCLGVRYGCVIDTIRGEECTSVKEVTRNCKAGGGCRSCHPEIGDLITELREERKAAGGIIKGIIGRVFGRRTGGSS